MNIASRVSHMEECLRDSYRAVQAGGGYYQNT